MQAFADWIILSSGWSRRLIAFVAGSIGALVLAPIDFAPAMVVPMVAAVWLLDGTEAQRGPSRGSAWRSAFGTGWWLGFGYFVAGLWWLGAAFIIDPQFTWALPLGVLGVPAVLALCTGGGFVIARLLWLPGPLRILSLALGLSLSEWARGHLFTGFPWNSLGMSLAANLVTAQVGALVGLDGMTFIAVAIFAAPATLVDGGTSWRRWSAVGVAGATTIALIAFGAVRLAAPPTPTVPGVVVRIVQPGLRPDADFSPQNKHAIVSRYLELSSEDDRSKHIKLADVTMLVWPESAFPFILTEDADELARIGASLPPNTTLVTGAARDEERAATRSRPAGTLYYNSIEVIAPGGAVIETYDKVHLVPFGEYLPFNALLRRLGLRNFVAIPGGFDAGHIRKALAVPGLPAAAPLICYEAIFPGQVVPNGPASGRPGYLLNITNDGWFGQTSGPWQHFAQARLRTIEEGLPMVRGAATGISAVIDPLGRVLTMLPLGPENIIDSALPQPIGPTPYARFRSWPLVLVWIATILLLLVVRLTIR